MFLNGCKASNALKSNQSDWVHYSDNNLGIIFQYPDTWKKSGEVSYITDISGKNSLIEVSFTDTISKSTFQITYHLAPKGLDFYQYSLSQFNASEGWYKNKKQEIEIAGEKAIVANTTINFDGKGNPLIPAIHMVIVDFLDSKKTGSFQLQFKCFDKENIEISKFNQVLSTIQLNN
jgi:hypothetical protein